MNRLKDLLQLLVSGLIVFALLFLIGGCVRWQFTECTGVGHSALYCIWTMGGRR